MRIRTAALATVAAATLGTVLTAGPAVAAPRYNISINIALVVGAVRQNR